MKITVHVGTGYVGCRRSDEIEIDDSDLEDLTTVEREMLIDEIAREKMFEMIDWGWEENT